MQSLGALLFVPGTKRPKYGGEGYEIAADNVAALTDGGDPDGAAVDGFTGFKTATAEELPDAVAVMDPFHVVRVAGEALDQCRRRVQQHTHGHRGRRDDPLYSARRTLHTGAACSPTSSASDCTACSQSTSASRSRRPGASIGA